MNQSELESNVCNLIDCNMNRVACRDSEDGVCDDVRGIVKFINQQVADAVEKERERIMVSSFDVPLAPNIYIISKDILEPEWANNPSKEA